MAYPKKYEVIGIVPVNDTAPGQTFTLEEPKMWKHNPAIPWLNEDALVAGGLIRLVSEAKLSCGICAEQGTAKEKKETYTAKQLMEHHAQKHPGFEPQLKGVTDHA